MPYGILIKLLTLLAAIATIAGAGYTAGRNSELAEHRKQQAVALYESSVLIAKNAELANEIEVKANEIEAINRKHGDDLKRAFASGVPARSACTAKRLPKTDNTGKITDTAGIETELSDEFKNFLVFESARADEIATYADSAYAWVNEQCKRGGAICDGR